MRIIIYCIVVLLCFSGFPVFGQKAIHSISQNLVYVKFPDDSGYDVQDRKLVIPAGETDLYIETLKNIGWWSRVHRLPKEQLTSYRHKAEQNLGKKLFDPNAEFHFHLYDPLKMREALQLLQKVTQVEKVLKVPIPRNAAIPNFSPFQHYGQSVATGINADSLTAVFGNRGAGIKICDIEFEYDKNHVDLPPINYVSAP